jgi:hypothetical protein
MQYKVSFDFTTVHSKGKFVGRSAQIVVETKSDDIVPNPDDDNLLYCCRMSIYDLKPSWKIFMLKIKEILKVETPHKKTG